MQVVVEVLFVVVEYFEQDYVGFVVLDMWYQQVMFVQSYGDDFDGGMMFVFDMDMNVCCL